MSNFVFSPAPFVMPGSEKADGDWPTAWRAQIEQIRAVHPELQHWGNLAVGSAWGDYSQDVLAINWAYPDQFQGADKWLPDFLAYCYVRQVAPTFKFGGTGLFSEDVYALGQQAPWKDEKPVAPGWAL